MPRPVKQIDPASSPLAGFAVLLQQLRVEAGSPPYRLLAERTNYSVKALSAAASDRAIPSVAVVRAYVAACGGDVAVWEQRYSRMRDEQQLHESSTGTAGKHGDPAPEPAPAGQTPQSSQSIKGVEDSVLAGAVEPQTDLFALPAPVEQPDLQQIGTAEDFLKALQDLRKAAGRPSLRVLEQRTVEAGKRVANSTMSDALKALAAGRLPSVHVVEGFVTACGVDPTPWLETRKRLVAGPVPQPQAEPEKQPRRRRSLAALPALVAIITTSAVTVIVAIGLWRNLLWLVVSLAAVGSGAAAMLLTLGVRGLQEWLASRQAPSQPRPGERFASAWTDPVARIAYRVALAVPEPLSRPVTPIVSGTVSVAMAVVVTVVAGYSTVASGDTSAPALRPPYIAQPTTAPSPTVQRSVPETGASSHTSPTEGSAVDATQPSVRGANVLTNPSFTTRAANTPSTTTLTGRWQGAPSAAAGWSAANNMHGTTTTTLVPSTGPDGGTMLHTCAPYDSGVFQYFVGAGNSPVDVTVMIRVTSGQAGIGVGTGGGTGITKYVSEGDWQTVAFTETSQIPATELIIYSLAAEGTTSCYDIDFASVQPRQAPVPDMTGGMSLHFTNMSWHPGYEQSWAINLTRSLAEQCPTADPCYHGSTWYADPGGIKASSFVLTVSRSGSKLTIAASDHGTPPNADQQYTGTDTDDLTFTGTFVERSTGRTAEMTLQSCVVHPDAPACNLLPKPS